MSSSIYFYASTVCFLHMFNLKFIHISLLQYNIFWQVIKYKKNKIRKISTFHIHENWGEISIFDIEHGTLSLSSCYLASNGHTDSAYWLLKIHLISHVYPFTISLSALPHKVKTQYLHFRSQAEYFLLPWKIPEVMSRRSILFHN